MTELKPCPFCGSSDLFIYELSDGIRCNNCMVKITDCEDWKDRWNRRADDDTELLALFNGWLDSERYNCDNSEHD